MTGLQAAILGGSALILLVLALRLGLQRHLPRKLFPALWCAAAVRLLLPVSIPTCLSIWNLFERTSASAAAGTISRTLLPFPDLTDGVAIASAPSASARVSPVSLVWLAGTVLLAAYVSIGCIFMVRGFRSARIAPCPSMDVLLDLFRFRKSPRIRATSSRRAPLTFGVLRPVILLPEGLAAESEPFRLVLAHELAHVKRRDCVRKLLFTVCLCLYWWNPLVWCMVILAGHDMELACDEAVLRALGPGCRKAYALTLLSMAARSPAPAPLTASFSAPLRVSVPFPNGPVSAQPSYLCFPPASFLHRQRSPLHPGRSRLSPNPYRLKLLKPLPPCRRQLGRKRRRHWPKRNFRRKHRR